MKKLYSLLLAAALMLALLPVLPAAAAGLPFEEVKARVLQKNETMCEPPLPRREAVGVACSVFRTHQRNHPEGQTPADGIQKPDDSFLLHDFEGVEVCNESEEDAPWPEEVLHPGGLLEEIMDFTARASVRTHPVYSLAGAITVIATLAGQRVKTDTNLTTNIYCAALGRSASGKDAPKRAVSRLIGRVAREAGVLCSRRLHPCLHAQLGPAPLCWPRQRSQESAGS